VSQGNVAVVRRVIEAIAQRDRATVFALYDAEVELDDSRGGFGEVTGGKIRRGHEGLRQMAREWREAWEYFEFDIEDLIDAGEHVIAAITFRMRGRTSGVRLERSGYFSVWTIHLGKVTRVVWFPTREEALEAVGLDE
jgi:ketosteroid isomerase-like protein